MIIALGEGLLGTAFALGVLVGPEGPGWSVDVVVLGLAGTALTFGMWWIYFILPMGGHPRAAPGAVVRLGLRAHPLFGALAAVGAGLHAAAYYLEHHSVLGTTGTVLTVAVPVALYVVLDLRPLLPARPGSSTRSTCCCSAGTAVVAVASVAMAAAGAPMVWCLAVLALTPWVIGRGLRDRRLPPRRGGRWTASEDPVTAVTSRLAGSRACAHGGSTSSAIPTTS